MGQAKANGDRRCWVIDVCGGPGPGQIESQWRIYGSETSRTCGCGRGQERRLARKDRCAVASDKSRSSAQPRLDQRSSREHNGRGASRSVDGRTENGKERMASGMAA